MFFVIGLSPERKQLSFSQQGVCPVCGRMARFDLWRTANCLTLFFLPVCRFAKQYFFITSCCGASCALPPALGKAAAHGALSSIDLQSLHFSSGAAQPRLCPACGFPANPGFQFCPKCGMRL